MFRIIKIDAFTVVLPLTAPVRLSTITIPACDNLIVRISDDSGCVGWGEASSAPMMTGETSPGMVAAVRYMRHKLEKYEIEEAAALPDLIEPLMYGNHAAKSAIDMALLDLIGQHRKMPLYEILGGRQRERAAMIWRVSGAPDEIETAFQLPTSLARHESFVIPCLAPNRKFEVLDALLSAWTWCMVRS